jgi:hypothetical protein
MLTSYGTQYLVDLNLKVICIFWPAGILIYNFFSLFASGIWQFYATFLLCCCFFNGRVSCNPAIIISGILFVSIHLFVWNILKGCTYLVAFFQFIRTFVTRSLNEVQLSDNVLRSSTAVVSCYHFLHTT